uniref:Uncharacterized protein n=1 Tax=viral metagenome TaxID=1070528 RepID=A0A6C0AFX3_9ZZZZ|tara:strand:- start:19162 stop:19419 length:258 start_codon:yes stop_codon:yes gene_type:complete
MGNIKFTLSNKRKKRWVCKKNVTLKIDHPDKSTIRKTRKKTRKLRDKVSKMNNSQKRDLLINKGVLKPESKAPEDIVNTMLDGLV